MPPIDRTLIEKYIKGECTPEEEERIHLWIDDNDAGEYPSFQSEQKYRRREHDGWKRLASAMETRASRKPVLRHLLRYAAMLALLAGVWLFNYYSRGRLWWTGEKFSTGYGETRQVILPDSSVVILNMMSTLKVPASYGAQARELHLNGEAYFSVRKNAARPFIVYANNVATRALGTGFNVYAYPGETTLVSLAEGSVAVKAAATPAHSLTLRPGEEAAWMPGKQLHKQSFSSRERLGWMEHVLYFKDAGIEKVLSTLERYYGVKFDYSGLTDKNWKLNGEYRNLPLTAILESLSFNYNFRYRIDKNRVILSQ